MEIIALQVARGRWLDVLPVLETRSLSTALPAQGPLTARPLARPRTDQGARSWQAPHPHHCHQRTTRPDVRYPPWITLGRLRWWRKCPAPFCSLHLCIFSCGPILS